MTSLKYVETSRTRLTCKWTNPLLNTLYLTFVLRSNHSHERLRRLFQKKYSSCVFSLSLDIWGQCSVEILGITLHWGGKKRVDERQLSQVSTWLKDNKYFSALPTIKKPFIIMLCFPCIINLIDVTCELSTLVWNFSFLFCRLKVRRL